MNLLILEHQVEVITFDTVDVTLFGDTITFGILYRCNQGSIIFYMCDSFNKYDYCTNKIRKTGARKMAQQL